MNDTVVKPLVSIVMGSSSDLRIMQAAADCLRAFEIPHEIDIVSAHRTPRKLYSFAEDLLAREIAVVIAGAGGAAHLPGMIAALTIVPVIGVPVAATKLAGMDALLSIAQMPAGVPVATVAIDNAENAALLAAQIVALRMPELRAKLLAHRRALEDKVLAGASAAASVFIPPTS
jgi:5-(carboxyamino)imidazole ribonucleotide mutase